MLHEKRLKSANIAKPTTICEDFIMHKPLAKIALPESSNPFICEAANFLQANNICEPILSDNVDQTFTSLKNGLVDGIVTGIDQSSRDIIIKARDIVGVKKTTKIFSSLFLVDLPDKKYIISDGATCKNPTYEQLPEIVRLVYEASKKILNEETCKIAMLSFSTAGSGGNTDPSIIKIRQAIDLVKKADETIVIDGEMQLDAAINPIIARKKMPDSDVAGQANVLICPDITSANILYKSMEQVAGAKVYGPILLGFNAPISDLSRGSSVEDIIGTVETLIKLI